MYKLYTYNGKVVGVSKLENDIHIAFTFSDETNTEYKQYLSWLAEGNTPLPPDDQVTEQPK